MSSSALPAPGNLPSWSRVSTFDRSRYPRPFLRDRIQQNGVGDMDTSVDVRFLEKMTQSVQHRLLNHDRSIKFLQDQHSETLQKLHQEMEALKKENKELKFRGIVSQKSSIGAPSDTEENRAQSVPSDIKTILLQEEIKDLRQALKDSNSKNTELRKKFVSLQSRVDQKNSDEIPAPENEASSQKSRRRKFSVSNLSVVLPLNATLNPLQVRDTVDGIPRAPSTAECELIIQQLHNINRQQLAELSRLRADHLTVTTPRNPTPEPYATKSLEASPTVSTATTRLPRIPVRPKLKKPIRSTSSAELGSPLPLVVNSFSASIIESRKRQSKSDKSDSSKK